MKTSNVIDFGDLLHHAEGMGYGWNQAHNILDNFVPRYGMRDVHIGELEELDIEEDGDAIKILKSFFDYHNVVEFSIKPKSC